MSAAPKERLEDALVTLGGSPGPGILNQEPRLSVIGAQGDVDSPAARSMPHGIVEEISDQNFDHKRFGRDLARLNFIEPQIYPLFRRFRKQVGDDVTGVFVERCD